MLAAAGAVVLLRRRPRVLVLLTIGFAPYFLFDLLFQETFTIRYALPLLVPVAALAVATLRALPVPLAAAAAVPIVMFGAHVGGRSIAEYSKRPAPAFRLLADMRRAESGSSTLPVLAPDRRQSFDLRRPVVWTGAAGPAFERQLPSPPQHEWLEPVKYWNAGGRAPVWFVVDPRRTTIDLVQHSAPVAYRWTVPYPVLLSGTRPGESDWYRVDRPEWYVEDGWSLTPEAAGVADADRRGLPYGPIRGWIARGARRLMIGGRNFEPAPAHLDVTLRSDPAVTRSIDIPPGPFVSFLDAPAPAGDQADYAALELSVSTAARIAIEQFDASASRPVWAYGAGWHEQEFNPQTGLRWRWLSSRGELEATVPGGARTLTLRLEGESPRRYFDLGSRLKIAVGGSVVFDRRLESDFSISVPIEVDAGPAPAVIVLETDQTYAPAERSSRTQDRRRLGLRIFRCELSAPASAPGRAANCPLAY
jgi:hypothetical protein